jgi:hypothetical protein
MRQPCLLELGTGYRLNKVQNFCFIFLLLAGRKQWLLYNCLCGLVIPIPPFQIYLFIYFCSIGDWTQGLLFARQVSTTLVMPPVFKFIFELIIYNYLWNTFCCFYTFIYFIIFQLHYIYVIPQIFITCLWWHCQNTFLAISNYIIVIYIRPAVQWNTKFAPFI